MTSSHEGHESVVVEIGEEEEEAGSCEHEHQGATEELSITSGLLSIKPHVQRTHPNHGEGGEAAVGGRPPHRHSQISAAAEANKRQQDRRRLQVRDKQPQYPVPPRGQISSR